MKKCSDNRPILTIFTPTYNRAYTLPKLYHSLQGQDDNRFLWYIIDDGSSDHTRQLVSQWRSEGRVNIIYEYQENSGKPAAHNRAASACNTKLFTCVDSDDFLTSNAVRTILEVSKTLQDEIGMAFMRKRRNGMLISRWPKSLKCSTLREAYRKSGAAGDTMLVYFTKYIKKFSFPIFPGETFIPEAYLYDRLDTLGKLVFIHRAIYVCEYLEDGYTKSMRKVIKNNPNGYLAYIEQRLKKDGKLKEKIEDTIRYIAVSISCGNTGIVKRAVYPALALVTFPFGMCFFWTVYKRV